MKKLGFLTILLCISIGLPAADSRLNVLFIAIDDLRPKLGCYGVKDIVSPNIDRLASGGIVFERSYCMVPTCGASRSSLMTGLRPSPNRFVNYLARADEDAPGVDTINTHFKKQGYYTVSLGKIYHWREDSAPGWSEPAWRPKTSPYKNRENIRIRRRQAAGTGSKKRRRGPPVESVDVEDDAYGDGLVARRAVKDLQRLSKRDGPFFLAVGFYKPHLPFVAPKKYWDLYDAEKIELPKTYHRPKDAPDAAIHNFGELRAYAGVPAEGPLSDELAKRLIHGYSACVSYTDAQVGKVLDALDRLDLAKNTIVVLWGDHGWNLGEHSLWCKHCTFETSMRAPLIVRAPGVTGGETTRGLTEFIDIYPSLCEMASLPKPAHLDGKSFVPLLKNPSLQWKDSAIGRYRSGDTIRTDRYRFTEYRNRRDQFVARMLYDHEVDPDEDVNVSEIAKNRKLVSTITAKMREGKGVNFDWTTNFRKQVLTNDYYCDGIVSGDINRDGKPDIIAGPFWYEGPAFKIAHEMFPAQPFPKPPSPTNSMFSYIQDFNGDGWNDVLKLGRVHKHEAVWFENPGAATGHWKSHFVFERVKGESPPFVDIDGDARPEIICHDGERWGWISPNWAAPTEPWSFHAITTAAKYKQFYHGTGVGDVNGDGRLDLILNDGWWEQPVDAKSVPWSAHPFKFGERGGAQMFAYDVDGDGDNDIITSLDAHGWGLAWFEQFRRKNGEMSFEKHLIMGDRSQEKEYGTAFSQPHALELVDVDGDGLKDIITGKRLWAHGPKGDVEPNAAPVVYWFRLTRKLGEVHYEPRLVDKESGVGVQISVGDVTGDGTPDILTASKLGSFLFRARRASPRNKTAPVAYKPDGLKPAGQSSVTANKLSFTLHEIGKAGNKLGQTSLVDIDRDGDLDFVSGARDGDIWWWEYRKAKHWIRHTIGHKSPTDVGGVAFDVDGDGWVDQCSGSAWWRNPGDPSREFQRHDSGAISTHDNRVADIDGDGRLDLLAMRDSKGLYWYRIPKDPKKKWVEHRVGDARHSGLAPADIDGDGDIDLVVGNWWYENIEEGKHWKKHENIPFDGARYNEQGMATQNRLGDLDGDGDLDIAITDGETKGASAAWIENLDGKGGRWKAHELATNRGALHSLAIADFDGDGDLDIFTCEMAIGGSGRWFIFQNDGKGRFSETTIHDGVPGHETVVGDVDGDGDIDICSKPWNGNRHIYLENRLVTRNES